MPSFLAGVPSALVRPLPGFHLLCDHVCRRGRHKTPRVRGVSELEAQADWPMHAYLRADPRPAPSGPCTGVDGSPSFNRPMTFAG